MFLKNKKYLFDGGSGQTLMEMGLKTTGDLWSAQGLLNENNEQWENYKKNKASISEAEINSKIDLRNKARANKNYKEADTIRDELFDKGVLIEDKDGKTLWKFK